MSLDAARSARIARTELERLIATDAPVLSTTLQPGFLDAVEAYVALLLGANERLNLTRIVEPLEVARLHLLDALAVLPLIDRLSPRRALDLGSGGGVPGIVLALARPDIAWTLVDSVRKKCDAMLGFVASLGLKNAAVVAERAEILGRDGSHREQHDLVTARACASLPVLAELALPLIRVGGSLVAWKGAMLDEELRAGRAAAALLGAGEVEVHPTSVASLGQHRFVVIPKEGLAPEAYPRRAGEPARRPLG